MGVRVIDISNHQAGMDVEAVVRQNDVAAVFILTNDGTFVNSYFHAQADAAERAGAVVLPYVYLRPDWTRTIDTHLNVVGSRYTQSLVDVEDGSGGWSECWSAHNRLWAAGRDTPLLYWPRYHWQTMGSPDLSPLAKKVRGHWKSWYPDTVARGFDAGLAQVPGYVWDDNRGGIPVRIVQFTGTGRLSGYGGNLDLNYFPGSAGELRALLGDKATGGGGGDKELEMGTHLVRNRDTGAVYVVEIGTKTRSKWHVPNPDVLAALAELMGTPARDVSGYAAEFLANEDGSDIVVDVDEGAITAGIVPVIVAAIKALNPEGLSFDETVEAVREALRSGTNG